MKRVVLTSSRSAITEGWDSASDPRAKPDYVFTEDDWSNVEEFHGRARHSTQAARVTGVCSCGVVCFL